MPGRRRAALINCLSGFKSANLLGTRSASGQDNLALMSSAVHLGANPPLLGFVFRPHSVPRHTLENLTDTGWFTVNHVHSDIVEAAHQTSAKYPGDVSEFEAVGLTPEFTGDCPAPFVAECRIRMALKHEQTIPIEANDTLLVIGRIESVQLPGGCVGEDGFVDLERAGSVSLSGLEQYHTTKALIRLGYAEP